MLRDAWNWITSALSREPARLTIVRRYADANGSYVGELHMERRFRVGNGMAVQFSMVGASLDSLPLEIMDTMVYTDADRAMFDLDTRNDFLAPMPPCTVRVGAFEPQDNDRVRAMVARLPRRRIRLTIQNRFIEHVIARKA